MFRLLLSLGRICNFLILCTVDGTPWTGGISPSQGLYLHTEQHKQNKCEHKHGCQEWDSNSWRQYSCRRRGYALECAVTVIGLNVPDTDAKPKWNWTSKYISGRERERYLPVNWEYWLSILVKTKLEYLDVTVLRRGVGEVRVVAGRAPTCWQVWRGMQYRRSQCF
jgi:hypothetical protein